MLLFTKKANCHFARVTTTTVRRDLKKTDGTGRERKGNYPEHSSRQLTAGCATSSQAYHQAWVWLLVGTWKLELGKRMLLKPVCGSLSKAWAGPSVRPSGSVTMITWHTFFLKPAPSLYWQSVIGWRQLNMWLTFWLKTPDGHIPD